MAICAKQSEVTLVSGPVLTASSPIVFAALRLNFFGRIYVVYVKSANVGETATRALSAKAGNKFKFFAPVVWMLGYGVSVPPRLLTFRFAKLRGTWRPALPALSFPAPASLKVAALTTILPCSVLNSVGVHLSLATAVLARNFDAVLFHQQCISKYAGEVHTGYFEIACKRIKDAYAQPDMFVEQSKTEPPRQLDLMDAAE